MRIYYSHEVLHMFDNIFYSTSELTRIFHETHKQIKPQKCLKMQWENKYIYCNKKMLENFHRLININFFFGKNSRNVFIVTGKYHLRKFHLGKFHLGNFHLEKFHRENSTCGKFQLRKIPPMDNSTHGLFHLCKIPPIRAPTT